MVWKSLFFTLSTPLRRKIVPIGPIGPIRLVGLVRPVGFLSMGFG